MNKLQLEIRENLLTREARRFEQILRKKTGIGYVSISASGVMLLEWDANHTTQADIIKSVKSLGLNIENVQNTDEHSYKVTDGHDHYNLNIFGENTELYFAIISGIFWVSGIILSFISSVPETIATTLFVIGAIFGGVFTFFTAGKDLLRGRFEIDRSEERRVGKECRARWAPEPE